MMNKNLEKILNSLMEEGLEIKVTMINGVHFFDLNTGMKSECILREKDGEIFADTRFKKNISIIDFDDVLSVVNSCLCNRDFMNEEWKNILITHKWI